MSDNPRAFPQLSNVEAYRVEKGMTLRDYFAAAALQGWAGNPDGKSFSHEDAAVEAYRYADAMLAARGGGRSTDHPNYMEGF